MTGEATAISFIMHILSIYNNHRLKAFTKFDRKSDQAALINWRENVQLILILKHCCDSFILDFLKLTFDSLVFIREYRIIPGTYLRP